jgi:ketosteroid isomerase-like protein
MTFTRRLVAFGGALALGTSNWLCSSRVSAQSDDEAVVLQAVAALNKAMLDADRSRLEDLVADQLSYGHSGGMIQTKPQFVDVIVNKETIYKSMTLTEPLTVMAGNNAIVRHVASVEYESGGKAATAKIGVLQVWVRQDARWRLLARQAFKL